MTPPETLEAVEERLGRLALTGTGADFAAFYEAHEGKLYNVTYRVAGNPDVAAEATQEAFSRVWARREDLAARGVNVTAYLYRTARNLVIDHHRGRGRELATDEIDLAAGADVSFDADAEAGEMLLAQQDEIREANGRLPEKQRLVLALRELQGLSYEEIAEVMETTAGGVAQLLLRARISFRRELRLGQIDEDRLSGHCRAFLPEIVALIDDQLPAERHDAVREHLSNCSDCRAVKAACEEAGRRYRAWLPLAGLGAGAARAAPWMAAAVPTVTTIMAAAPSGPARSPSRRARTRAATIGAAAALVVAVPLAMPSLTTDANPPAPAADEPEVGPCVWCERLDAATAPGEPAEASPSTPRQPRPRATPVDPTPASSPVRRAPATPATTPPGAGGGDEAPDPPAAAPPRPDPEPPAASSPPPQVAGESRAPEPAPGPRDPQPLPEPAPEIDREPPPPKRPEPAGPREDPVNPGTTDPGPAREPDPKPPREPDPTPGTDPRPDDPVRDPVRDPVGTPPPTPDLNTPDIIRPPGTAD